MSVPCEQRTKLARALRSAVEGKRNLGWTALRRQSYYFAPEKGSLSERDCRPAAGVGPASVAPTAACRTPALQSVVASLLRARAGRSWSWPRRGHEALDRSRSRSAPLPAPSKASSHVGTRGATGAALPSATEQAVRQGCVWAGGAASRRAAESTGHRDAGHLASLPIQHPRCESRASRARRCAGRPSACSRPWTVMGAPTQTKAGAGQGQSSSRSHGSSRGDLAETHRATSDKRRKCSKMASGRAVGRLAPSRGRGIMTAAERTGPGACWEVGKAGPQQRRAGARAAPAAGVVFGKRQTWPK
jgi:hypothetical protein